MRHSLIFGGVDSADYGIYITGKSVYDAPAREVEKIVIPGRNGLHVIDKGRYENISVEYPAFAFGKTRAEFQQKIDAFRNAVAAQVGYQRLTDTYRPDEYRMALFSEGLTVDVGPYGGSGKFDLKFDCKPQRFLTSGESEISINESPQTVENPTLYESKPLIIADGTGTIGIGSKEITIQDVPVGDILIAAAKSSSLGHLTYNTRNKEAKMNVGDEIILHGLQWDAGNSYSQQQNVTSVTTTSISSGMTADITYGAHGFSILFTVGDIAFTARATSSENKTYTANIRAVVDGTNQDFVFSVKIKKYRYSNNQPWDVQLYVTKPGDSEKKLATGLAAGEMRGNSTATILGSRTYIDCDTGEAYKLVSNEPVQVNPAISFDPDIPALIPGNNSVTYTSGITRLRIVPRWWQL